MPKRSAPVAASKRTQFQKTEIDFLILADRAEAINGKLYMMGGAWDRMAVVNFQQPVSICFALGILVPWTDTNEEQPVNIWIETEDGTRLQPEVTGALNMGRPPDAVRGQSLRTILAVNGQWMLPGPGTYRVVASLANGELKAIALHATEARVQIPA